MATEAKTHLLEEWREERGGRGCVRGGTRYWRGREARARARACAAQLQTVSVGAYIARWQAEASGQAGCWMLLDAAPLAAGWAGVSWGAGVAGGCARVCTAELGDWDGRKCAVARGARRREARGRGAAGGAEGREVRVFFSRWGEAGLSRGLLEAGFARLLRVGEARRKGGARCCGQGFRGDRGKGAGLKRSGRGWGP